MAGGTVDHVELSGVAAAVPTTFKTSIDNEKLYGEERARWIAKKTGVVETRIAPEGMCASDLCYIAAEKLLEELSWSRDSIDLLVFVSVTPDYRAPATACTLQHRLKLSKSCAAFDISLGCSGYVYGLWVVSNLLSTCNAERALLLVGDTMTRVVSPLDSTTYPFMGDAGTATAVQRKKDVDPMHFQLGSDGAGAPHIIIKAGGFRHPSTEETRKRVEIDTGVVSSLEDLSIDGLETFAFNYREVPPLMDVIMKRAGWTFDDVDAVIMPQANLSVLQYLAKKIRIPHEKIVENLTYFGDTGTATIPVALCHKLGNRLRNGRHKLIFIGVGAGLSWAALAVDCGPLVLPPLMYVSTHDVNLSKPY